MRATFLASAVAVSLLVSLGCGGSSIAISNPASVVVAVSPVGAQNLDAGETANLIAATTNDSSGKGVTWALTCGAANCGTLSNVTSTSVTYNAPATLTASIAATVTATTVATPSASNGATINVSPLPTIAGGAISMQLPTAVPGAAYSYALTSAGGVAPISWTLPAGQLPPGVTLASATGLLSGTPTAGGTYTASATATDSATPTRSVSISLTIPVSAALAVPAATLPAAGQNVAYTATLAATGGFGALKWSVSGGALPAGVTLSNAGVLSGTPTSTGSFPFTVNVQDSSVPVATANASYTLAVNPSTGFHVTTTALASAAQNSAYTTTLAATGGTGNLQWTIATGSLPAGITLTSAGLLSGQPTVIGIYAFTVAVQDSAVPRNSTSASLSLVVTPPPPFGFTTSTLTSAIVATPYLVQLATVGGKGGVTYAISSGTLPNGMNLATGILPQLSGGGYGAGTLFGNPTTAGTFNFTLKATDSTTPTTQTVSQNYTLVVAPLLGTNNGQLNGHYAFLLSGFTDPNLCAVPMGIADKPMTMAGSFIADGNGNVTMGEYDSTVCGLSTTLHTFTGTYAVGPDQRGRLVLSNPINAQSVFAFSLNQIQAGVAQQAQIIEFDDLSHDFNGSRGSGLVQLQTPAAFTQAAITGNYVYGFRGATASAGLLGFNGAGTVSGPSVSGTYSAPDGTFGRMSITLNGAAYAAYVVNGQQLFVTSNGATTPVAGQIRQQQAATFSNGSLNGSLVGYGNTLYTVSADGAGNISGTVNPATSRNSLPYSTTYSVSSNGLALLGDGGVIWLYAQNAGFRADATGSTPILFTYESAVAAPSTFDLSAGTYSTGPVSPNTGFVILSSGTITSPTSQTQDVSNNVSQTPGTPLYSSTSTVPGSSAFIPISATRAVMLSGSNLGIGSAVVINIVQR